MKLIKLIWIAIFKVLLLAKGIAKAHSPPHPDGGKLRVSGEVTHLLVQERRLEAGIFC